MRFQKSCGAVVFTRRDNEILYVIIRQTNGDYGFPKGHMEPGEDEYATALREIREEVGLTVEIKADFRREICYPFPGKTNMVKQCVYFIAECWNPELVCQAEEVSAVYLLPYEQAGEMLTFSETKAILVEAHKFLK